jgi:hypothetical protein
MPTLISNENYAIRWDKTECNQYTISNISSVYNANVVITDETGTYTETFNLAPDGSNTIVLPGDGVFKLCAYAFDLPLNPEELETTNGKLSVIEFPIVTTIGLAIVSSRFYDTGYTTFVPTPGLFISVPASYQDFVDDLQGYVTANGGGIVTMLAPGSSLPNVPVNNNAYQLVVQANDVYLTDVTGNYGTPDEIAFDANLYCSYEYVFDENKQYVASFIINGTEVVPVNSIWNMSTVQGTTDAETTINTFLLNDGYSVADILSLKIYLVNPSPGKDCDLITLTAVELGPGETQCDYIYEFCDLYACLSRLMNRWLCQDPCADKCTAAGESYEEARRKAVELSTMFFHALMPLVTTDRLWYLGNWDISDQRLSNVNNILELYKKMRDYVKNCGFDCGCGCPDNCGDCQPCNGYSYAPSPSNPSTPCGCK